MSGGIAEHDGARAIANRGEVELLDGFRVAARRVFGRVHDLQALRDRIFDGLFGGFEEKVDRPAFGKAAQRTRSEKCRNLDRQAGLLRDLDDGTDVVFMRAGRAVGTDLHFVRDDFTRQGGNVLHGARSGAGQTEIERVDAERFHQMEDFDFLLDRGIANGGRLQAVAQSFIGQQHRPRRPHRLRVQPVPVVDEFRDVQN